MERRNFLKIIGSALLSLNGCRSFAPEGLFNPCLSPEDLPESLLSHELVEASWEGLDPLQIRDVHVHLAGLGHNGSGVMINPHMRSIFHPVQFTQRIFFLNASCVDKNDADVDRSYVQRLYKLNSHFPRGAKCMLLAFDHAYDEDGQINPSNTALHIPNHFAKTVAESLPDRFEWVSSIHPYRKDSMESLIRAYRNGARAVKWLPPAMAINPASPLCDRFYETLARLKLPLLTHGGEEQALYGAGLEEYGNPLLLRRALEHGVRVIIAHCASDGQGIDLDKGKNGPLEENFILFSRLMEEKSFEHLLSGDISAVTQKNRVDIALKDIIERDHWHHRLLNGSDYPLPGVMPLTSMALLVERKLLSASEAKVLEQIRRYNPLLFDFTLKRTLKYGRKKLGEKIFQTRNFFTNKRELSEESLAGVTATATV